MQQKVQQFMIKGMQRDTSISKASNEFSFENKNIRITAREDNTLLSVTNERGNLEIEDINIPGEVLGYATINKYLVLFTTEESTDHIIRIDFNSPITSKELYAKHLGFNRNNPIETLAIYENEDIQKVYWVDGINQPRMINIVAKDSEVEKWKKMTTPFDFVPTLKLQEEVEITRNQISNGLFAPGVIQYVLTYFNQYGQESNPFYTSPLYYTSFQDRGGSPEDKVSNSFSIKVFNIDKDFDYIRIYSILRTSIDATPLAKKVVDLVPALSSSKKFKDLADSTDKTGRFESQGTPTKDYSIDDFRLYPRITETENYHISINRLPVIETLDGKFKYIIDPNDSTTFTDGSKKGLYTLLKAPFSGTSSSNNYFCIYEPTYIIFTCDEENNVISYTLETMSKGNASFYMGKEIEYDDIYYCEFDDSGTTGETIDPTELLYLGGEDITVETLAQKDNTLFLGNLHLNRTEVPEDLRNSVGSSPIIFKLGKTLTLPKGEGYYPYENSLKYNSIQNKTFKSNEWYRFGVQFQHKTGRWSEPIWIDDIKNTLHPSINGEFEDGKVTLPIASTSFNYSVIEQMLLADYEKIRPVVVFPKFNERECICQGILCPTVYNMQDRINNAPFVQSSWFVRANSTKVNSYDSTIEEEKVGLIKDTLETETNGGSVPEFRHNQYLPSSMHRNAEIQSIYKPVPAYIDGNLNDNDKLEYINNHSENFYVDQSIVTLHSPDIEFDNSLKNLDTTGLQLRITGIVPLTSFYGDIDIQTSTPQLMFKNADAMTPGFYHSVANIGNISTYGDRNLLSGIFWIDTVYRTGIKNSDVYEGYVIYPWHRNGSLNNQRSAVDNYRSAMLQYKKLSNLKFSYNSIYLDNEVSLDPFTNKNIIDSKIFDSNEITAVKLKYPKNKSIIYYGNIDTVLTFNNYDEVTDKRENSIDEWWYNRIYGYPVITGQSYCTDKKYNINETVVIDGEALTGLSKIFNSRYFFNGDYKDDKVYTEEERNEVKKQDPNLDELENGAGTGRGWHSSDPIRMKYKSTPHAVLVLDNLTDYTQIILPRMEGYPYGYEADKGRIGYKVFWDEELSGYYSHSIDNIGKNSDFNYGYLWIGELYNPNVVNRFGGQTQEAFENNKWLPCGEAISIYDNGTLKQSIEVKWTEGDTYYQRYDHVKTYPFTLEDQNSISEVVSFMCETRVNLDGRYDKNRSNLTNFGISPENFNKINDVYNQENNFFVYRALNYDKFSLDEFPNSITWTKEKQLGELVDTWTNITMASTLDLDGEKGEVSSLNTFNNEVFAFQKHGISHILFNSRVQIPTSDGAPIEITNGLKVEGKRYLSEVGCHNKWAITTTPNGIYFIDNITNGIYLFTGENLEPISEKLGFGKWVEDNSSMELWDNDYNNFRTFYDKVNGDVYFTTKDTSLCFSEALGQFTSFMDYKKLPAMFNVDNSFYTINKGKLWKQNAGDYNYFFGEYKPYSIEYRVSPDPYADKTFTNIEFRADTFDNNALTNETFNKLTVYNEYQKGEVDLQYHPIKPSTLKKKFRMWRAFIPRDKNNNRDRIRNPWINLKLERNIEDTHKTELHDLLVYYYD